MVNQAIRDAAQKAGVKLWEVAEAMGVVDSTFSRQLRREFTAERREQVLDAIKRLAAEKGGVGNADS